jgi:uncharacterized membrane protein
MSTIERSIEVRVPTSTAYDQWTQFEEFPRFMEGVERVEQIDDTTLRWRSRAAGRSEEWTARIDEQIPGKRIAWHSVEGRSNGGVVTFHRLADDRTRVMLQLAYEPEGAVEKAGDWLGLAGRRIEGDLRRFKEFVESRGEAPGAWRGRVPAKDERPARG